MTLKNGVLSLTCIASWIAFGAGCTMDTFGTDAPVAREQLQNRTALQVATDASMARVDGRELAIQAGEVQLELAPDGEVQLASLQVDFGDVTVSGEDPVLEGLQLTDVRISLIWPKFGDVEWTQAGDAGFTSLEVDLMLDWALVTKTGTVVPLGGQRISDVQIELSFFTAENGTLTATLYGFKPGVVWQWAGLAEMANLEFDVRAHAGGTAPGVD